LDTAARRPAFVTYFHGAHPAFSFRANTEPATADHNPDIGRWPFLDDPTTLRSRFLNDVVVRKGRRNKESCQGSAGQNGSHGKSPINVSLGS
jgi:hypothetical protein